MLRKRTIILLILLCLSVIVCIPIGIDRYIIGNKHPSNITNAEWVGFLGSYVGAITGGVISLLGIVLTIRFTREQNREDRELQIRPFFNINYISEHYRDSEHTERSETRECLGFIHVRSFETDSYDFYDCGVIVLFLKNVGAGPAVNINFEVEISDQSTKREGYFTNRNFMVTTESLSTSEIAWVSVQLDSNIKAPTEEELLWHTSSDGSQVASIDLTKYKYPKNFKFIVLVKYNDLLGNDFCQKLCFNCTFYFSYDKANPHFSSDIILADVCPVVKVKQKKEKRPHKGSGAVRVDRLSKDREEHVTGEGRDDCVSKPE